MKHTSTTAWKRVLLVLVVAAVAVAPVLAQDTDGGDRTVPEFIRETGLHRISGYVSLGLAGATAAFGLIGVEEEGALSVIHPVLGISTMGSMLTSQVLGTIAYRDRLARVWPHTLLNAAAVVGFGLNAFVWEQGSMEHRITGIASISALAGGYVSIILIER